MKRLRFAPWFALALFAAGCGNAASKGPLTPDKPKDTLAKPGDAPTKPVDDPSCPIVVPGTSMSVEDAPNGAALVFVTTDNVAEVRKRAAALATMYNKHEGPQDAMGMMIGSKATAAVSEVPGGARVAFTALKADDPAALKEELHMHAHHLTGGSCKMGM